MKDTKIKFLKLLLLECEDFIEDINVLIEKEKEKMDAGLISEYVYMENLVIFKSEIHSIKNFISDAENLDVSHIDTIDELLAKLKEMFVKRFREYGFKEITINILLRKIEKVSKYIAT